MGDAISKPEITFHRNSPRGRPDREGLYLLASEQAGYVTSAQGMDYSMLDALLSYHARPKGSMRRVYRGVYRFRDFPPTPREQVVAAWLAVGKESAVVSDESALDLWDLTDLIPDAVHLTVPRGRRNLPRLPGVRIHTTTRPLGPADVRVAEWSLRVTSPQRTLLDVASHGAEPSQVILGIRQARARGWIDEAELRAQALRRGHRVAHLIDQALAADGDTGDGP